MLKTFLKFSFGSWLSAIISFFTVPVITLLINPEEFGKAAIYTLVYGIISQIILFGLDQSFVRFFNDYTEEKRPSLLWYSILPSLVIWCLVSAILFLFWKTVSIWLISEAQFLITGLLSINLLIYLFNRYSMLIVRMQKKGVFFSLLHIILNITNAIGIIIYSRFVAKTFYAVIFGSICSLFMVTIISIIKEYKFWLSHFSISLTDTKEILRYGLPFLPTCLMSIFFEGMDKIFIRKLAGFNELGLYTVAFKIVAALSILQSCFAYFWVPTSYENYKKNPLDKALYENTFKYVSFILVLCGLGLIAIKDIIVLLFNNTYIEAASLMPFLIFNPIMHILAEITFLGINFTKKTYWHIIIFGILLLLCPLFNFIFISWLGVKGAALAAALSYICYFYLRTIISTKLYPMNFHLLQASFGIILLFIAAGANTFLSNKSGVFSAFLILIIYSLFNISTIREIIEYFKQIILNRKAKETKIFTPQ